MSSAGSVARVQIVGANLAVERPTIDPENVCSLHTMPLGLLQHRSDVVALEFWFCRNFTCSRVLVAVSH